MQPEELIQTILAQGPVLTEEDYRYARWRVTHP